MSTAVCTVMCSEPEIRAPASGCDAANSRSDRHQAGHLVLGEIDLLTAELGEGQVGNLVVDSSCHLLDRGLYMDSGSRCRGQ